MGRWLERSHATAPGADGQRHIDGLQTGSTKRASGELQFGMGFSTLGQSRPARPQTLSRGCCFRVGTIATNGKVYPVIFNPGIQRNLHIRLRRFMNFGALTLPIPALFGTTPIPCDGPTASTFSFGGEYRRQ